jgi:hypothetical protein
VARVREDSHTMTPRPLPQTSGPGLYAARMSQLRKSSRTPSQRPTGVGLVGRSSVAFSSP